VSKAKNSLGKVVLLSRKIQGGQRGRGRIEAVNPETFDRTFIMSTDLEAVFSLPQSVVIPANSLKSADFEFDTFSVNLPEIGSIYATYLEREAKPGKAMIMTVAGSVRITHPPTSPSSSSAEVESYTLSTMTVALSSSDPAITFTNTAGGPITSITVLGFDSAAFKVVIPVGLSGEKTVYGNSPGKIVEDFAFTL